MFKILMKILGLAAVFTLLLFSIEKYLFNDPDSELKYIDSNHESYSQTDINDYHLNFDDDTKLQDNSEDLTNQSNSEKYDNSIITPDDGVVGSGENEKPASLDAANADIMSDSINGVANIDDVDGETEVEQFSEEKKHSSEIFFNYYPKSFVKKAIMQTILIKNYILLDIFDSNIDSLSIEMHADKGDRRGNMKNKTISLRSQNDIPASEIMSVFVHEFAHYFDIYIYDFSIYGDFSDDFYDISWQDTFIIKPGQDLEDFVSGYATTNKYEDFAETMTYFILHNRHFLEKSKNNSVLQMKYNYFRDQVFSDLYFTDIDFTVTRSPKSYYWDITKIRYNHKKLLQYLKNKI